MKPPKNIGVVYDWHAEQRHQSVVHVDRPSAIAPELGTTLTGGQLATLVAESSAWLAAAGASYGSRVGIVKDNHLDVQLLAAAVARIGGLPATISGLNRTEDIVFMLQKLDPSVIVIGGTEFEQISQVKDYPLAGVPHIVLGAVPASVKKIATFQIVDFLGASIPRVRVRPDDEPMMVTHTSGTTNTPKLVVHTANTNRAGTRVEFLPLPGAVSRHSDTVLSSISFAHSRAYAWMIAQLYWAPNRLVAVGDHSADVAEKMFSRYRPTTVEATPNVYQHWRTVVRRRPELFRQVRLYINTFDAMHSSIARPFIEASRRRTVVWGHSWGQSEVGPIAAGIYTKWRLKQDAARSSRHMNRLGVAWPGIAKVRVVDPATLRKQPAGKPGILLVTASSVCVDYLDDRKRYTDKWIGRWWNTGDYGSKDLLGRIHFLDRAVDRVEGSSAIEIETVLLERIVEAEEIVILANGHDSPLPVVSMRPGTTWNHARWDQAIQDLPQLKDPVFVPWEDLPRTSTWKIRRNDLRAQLGRDHVVAADDLDQRFI